MSQNSRTAGTTPKGNYNKHFPRSFLLNYGEALQDIPDDKILARLKSWNCEWLSRPNIAMSEMASTLKENINIVEKYKGTVFTTTFVDQLHDFCHPILPALRRLDNKDKYCQEPADKDDVLDVIEAVHKEEATETLFMDAFNACGPVLMMAIHVLALNCLLHNPDAMADQSVQNTATDALRANPTKHAVNQYLLDSILQKRRTVNRGAENVWDRSLYNTGDSNTTQQQTTRRRRLDTNDDDPTPSTSTSSTTPRRRLATVPEFANTPRPTNTSRDRRLSATRAERGTSRTRREDEDEDNDATQLYASPPPPKRQRMSRTTTRARDLPTTFDDDEEEQPRRSKNKRPLTGPPTAKNRDMTAASSSDSEDSDEIQKQPVSKSKAKTKPATKPGKRIASRHANLSDLDDDALGITPRTPPESPFYRGHRESATKKTSATPEKRKKNKRDEKATTSKQQTLETITPEHVPDQPTMKKKKKNKKNALQELASDQDRLYQDLANIVKKRN